MPDVGITNPKTAYAEAEQWAKELSELFPPPMCVELDWMAHTMFNICKKKYAYIKMQKNGEPVLDPNDIGTKGIALARRDNCQFQRQLMRRVLWNVLTKQPMKETLEIIIDDCIKLMSGGVPWTDLVMIKGLGANYKSPSYFMKIFGDELSKIGKPANPGDRLEYVIVTSKGVEGKQLLGYKMRLPYTYLERLKTDDAEKIDYIYYIEKILKNCIEQIFKVGFQNEIAILEAKYLDNDQNKVFNILRTKGYGPALDQLMMQYNQNKTAVIDVLLQSDIGKLVKQLKSCFISKRGKFTSRITKEPIKILLKIIQQKMQLTNYIKTLVPVSEIPKITKIKLNVVQPGFDITTQQVQQKWIETNALKYNNNNNNNINEFVQQHQKQQQSQQSSPIQLNTQLNIQSSPIQSSPIQSSSIQSSPIQSSSTQSSPIQSSPIQSSPIQSSSIQSSPTQSSPIQSSPIQSYPIQSNIQSQQSFPIRSNVQSQRSFPIQLNVQSQQSFPIQLNVQSQQSFPIQLNIQTQQPSPIRLNVQSQQQQPSPIQLNVQLPTIQNQQLSTIQLQIPTIQSQQTPIIQNQQLPTIQLQIPYIQSQRSQQSSNIQLQIPCIQQNTKLIYNV